MRTVQNSLGWRFDVKPKIRSKNGLSSTTAKMETGQWHVRRALWPMLLHPCSQQKDQNIADLKTEFTHQNCSTNRHWRTSLIHSRSTECPFHSIGSSQCGQGIPGMNSPKRKPQFVQMLVRKSSMLLMLRHWQTRILFWRWFRRTCFRFDKFE